MPVELIDASGKLLQIKIRGLLQKADHERMIQIAKEAIAREGKIRALIIAEGFEGWERHEEWGDVSFMMAEGQHIEKMAIVGDEKWRVTRRADGADRQLLGIRAAGKSDSGNGETCNETTFDSL